LLADLRAQSRSDPSKGRDFEKAVQLSKDISNCRIRKIVSLAAAPAQTEDVLTNLAGEERSLYRSLSRIVIEWRSKIENPRTEP
jgi:DNA replication initiation complex subunit (GINS family)